MPDTFIARIKFVMFRYKTKCCGFSKNMLPYECIENGSMPEWLMGTDCKSVSKAYVGSNPTRPNDFKCSIATQSMIPYLYLLRTFNLRLTLKFVTTPYLIRCI